jgi:lipid A disaccharide synthetase
MIVPEFLQGDASISNLTEAMLNAMSGKQAASLVPIFEEMHQSLALDSGDIAATAIEELIVS